MKKIMMVLFIVLSSVGIQSAEELIFKDINFERESYGESIKIILKEIAKENGSQIKIEESVKDEKETFSFSMPLKGAFKMIIDGHKLNYRMQNGVIIVSGLKKADNIIVLKYIKAPRLKEILHKYKIFDESVKMEYGEDALDNTVHITGNEEAISKLENIIKKLEDAELLKITERKIQAEREERDATAKANRDERKRQAILAEKRLEIEKEKEKRDKEKLELAKQQQEWEQAEAFEKAEMEKSKMEMEQRKTEQLLKEKEAKLKEEKAIFDSKIAELSKQMNTEIIPLKFINVSKSEIDFQGKKIQVDSLEETLKGLLGSSVINENLSKEFGLISREMAYIKVDQRTNSLIIKDFPNNIEKIKNILTKLDKRPQLIEIEVTIAMGNSGFTEELGMKLGGIRNYGDQRSYGLSSGDAISKNLNDMRQIATTESTTLNNNSSTTSSEEKAINDSFKTATLLEPIGALGLSSSMLFKGAKSMLNFQLNAMENEGAGKVLSNPRIITLNNRGATILSGDSVSIPTATADKMSLQTINTGISIKAKPHLILAEGEDVKNAEILLDISIEKSSLGIVTREKIETATSKVNSNVIIKNGQTLILGGLFQYSKSDSEGGIPFLKDIPLIGLFFKTKSNALHKNELLFFITPKIVTQGAVREMQNSGYMGDLELHKRKLTRKVNYIDTQKSDVITIKNEAKREFHRKTSTSPDMQKVEMLEDAEIIETIEEDDVVLETSKTLYEEQLDILSGANEEED